MRRFVALSTRQTPTTSSASKIQRWLRGQGVEIGAFLYPIKRERTIFVDKFREFAGQQVLADYYGEASALPFYDSSLDYVVASHVIEHVANPVKALLEWYRVLKSGGVIYMVVPDRRYTFDHNREVTSLEHLWDDYRGKTTDCDSTHIDEFVDNVDFALFEPTIPEAARAERRLHIKADCWAAIRNRQEINIHFHVFEPQSMRDLLLKIGKECEIRWQIVDFAERYPEDRLDGFLFVIQILKERRFLRENLKRAVQRWGSNTYPLTESAVAMK
ncbi:MAG: methyltransferase domain-containing protein [Candidatus Binatia bacterium]